MDATYDANEPRQIRSLRAAYDGITRAYPHASSWGSADDASAVTQLFTAHASQTRPSQ